MYIIKRDNVWQETSHPQWIGEGGLVSDDYLKANGFYLVIEPEVNISRKFVLNPISEWTIDEDSKTVVKTYTEIPDEEYRGILESEVIAKTKDAQRTAIDTATFTHDGKQFSCNLVAQSNYMGLKTAIDAGIAAYPSKCWSITGEEFVINNEGTLKTLIGKLFAVVYPIREKANTDEQIARNATISQLEELLK